MADIIWDTAADWDAATDEEAVIHNDIGVRNSGDVALGFDTDIAPVSNAVAYWHCDDSSSPLVDVIGGYDATLNDGTLGQVGPLGTNAVEFTDANDPAASASVSSDPTGGGSFTIATWISIPSVTANRQTIFSANDGSVGSYKLSITSAGEIYFLVKTDNNNSEKLFHSSTDFDAGDNFFIVAKYDDTYSTDNGRLWVYLDGSNENALIGNSRPSLAADIHIGNDGRFGNEPFNGRIGPALLWNTDLTHDEITALSNAFEQGYHQTGWKAGSGVDSATVTAADVIGGTVDYGTSTSFEAHDDANAVTSDPGIVINPNQDLEGIRVTIADYNGDPSGYTTAYVAPLSDTSNRLDEKDVSGLANGESFDLYATLSAGTDYAVLMGAGGSEHTRSDLTTPSFPYESTDFDVVAGSATSSSSSTTSRLYQFSDAQAVLYDGEGGDATAYVDVRQDTDGDGTIENSQELTIDDGTNTYDLTGFTDTSSDYQLNITLNSRDQTKTAAIQDVTLSGPTTHSIHGDLTASGTVETTASVSHPISGQLSGQGDATGPAKVGSGPTYNQAQLDGIFDLQRSANGAAYLTTAAEGATALARELDGHIFGAEIQGEAFEDTEASGVIKTDY